MDVQDRLDLYAPPTLNDPERQQERNLEILRAEQAAQDERARERAKRQQDRKIHSGR